MITKRSIPTPQFKDLRPVKKNRYASNNRWLVELLGNRICVEEHYGGQVSVAFAWNHDSNLSANKVMTEINLTLATGNVVGDLVRSSESTAMTCKVKVLGFKLPNDIGGDLITVDGVMKLIRSLPTLPVECAVPVGTKTVEIQAVGGFPRHVIVETHIRDHETLGGLLVVQQRLEDTGHKHAPVFGFITDLMWHLEDASMNDRTMVGHLNGLARDVVQMLRDHGKCVELYERYGEYRLCKDDCDKNSVSASATETLFAITLGIAVLPVRSHQSNQFEQAEIWTAPEHYEHRQFSSTATVSGYYDRFKVELMFIDHKIVDKWRRQLAGIVAHSHKKRTGSWIRRVARIASAV